MQMCRRPFSREKKTGMTDVLRVTSCSCYLVLILAILSFCYPGYFDIFLFEHVAIVQGSHLDSAVTILRIVSGTNMALSHPPLAWVWQHRSPETPRRWMVSGKVRPWTLVPSAIVGVNKRIPVLTFLSFTTLGGSIPVASFLSTSSAYHSLSSSPHALLNKDGLDDLSSTCPSVPRSHSPGQCERTRSLEPHEISYLKELRFLRCSSSLRSIFCLLFSDPGS